MPALADAMTGPTEQLDPTATEAAALVDELSDDELSLRPDAAAWLAVAELYLDLYAEADAHASRALTLARARPGEGIPCSACTRSCPGSGTSAASWPRLPSSWTAPSRPGACSGPRRLSPGTSSTGPSSRSPSATWTSRSPPPRRASSSRASLDEGFVTAWAAVRLAGVLLETGQPDRAVELLLGRAGGEELTLIPGGWRAYCLELLTRCWLALDRPDEAERAAG